jgi:hypothetical protein
MIVFCTWFHHNMTSGQIKSDQKFRSKYGYHFSDHNWSGLKTEEKIKKKLNHKNQNGEKWIIDFVKKIPPT